MKKYKYTSLQEVFDTVVSHLRKQGEKSDQSYMFDEEDLSIMDHQCLYRTPGNLKCAVGCLIPDDIYSEDMESTFAYKLLRDYPKFSSQFDPSLFRYSSSTFYPKGDGIESLLGKVQDVHDDNPVSEWEKGFKLVAEEFDLNYTSAA